VDAASRVADALAEEGREIDFRVEGSDGLEITLLEAGERRRTLTALETLAIAAGEPA
jgi:hypothetical protein